MRNKVNQEKTTPAASEWRRKWARFRKQKRAYWSLVALVLAALTVLPAGLLCNSRPLLISWDEKMFFPVFNTYTYRDFGGVRNSEPDYHGARFKSLVGLSDKLKPARVIDEVLDILSDFDMAAALAAELKHAAPAPPLENSTTKPAKIWWPPVPYDYAYIDTGASTGKTALVAPWSSTAEGTGETIEAGWDNQHFLGTDDRGRDVLARLVYGLRVSLVFGLTLALASTGIGSVFGAIQGYFAGWIDLIGQRAVEIWGSLPQLYLLMILSSLLARNIMVLFFILLLTSWMAMNAYMRAEFLRGRNLDYVRAARALGVSNTAIMFRHILPNSLTPIITFLPFSISGGILALVSLDFLGLGVPSPYPSIGELLSQGHRNLHALWISVPTFLVLGTTITLLTFIGDGFRNAFDPRANSAK